MLTWWCFKTNLVINILPFGEYNWKVVDSIFIMAQNFVLEYGSFDCSEIVSKKTIAQVLWDNSIQQLSAL